MPVRSKLYKFASSNLLRTYMKQLHSRRELTRRPRKKKQQYFCMILRVKQHCSTIETTEPVIKASYPRSHPAYFHRNPRKMKGTPEIILLCHFHRRKTSFQLCYTITECHFLGNRHRSQMKSCISMSATSSLAYVKKKKSVHPYSS